MQCWLSTIVATGKSEGKRPAATAGWVILQQDRPGVGGTKVVETHTHGTNTAKVPGRIRVCGTISFIRWSTTRKKREGTGSPAPVTYFFFSSSSFFSSRLFFFFFFFSCATRTVRNSTHVGPRKMEQPERARLSGLVVTATTVFSTSQYFNCNSFLSLTRGQISIQLRNNKVSIYLCHLYELDFEANSCGRQTSPRKGS